MNNYSNIPDLSRKVAIVTGANSGTGYGITYHLAKHGCKVIMASRCDKKLNEAIVKLKEELPNPNLAMKIVDITSMKSINDFCNRIKSKYNKIDFLVNNAGAGNHSLVITEDGYDENLTVNYLGHFALTTQLLPIIKDNSRIVNFSSIGYKKLLKHDLNVDNLMCKDPKNYSQMQEYCKAKLCSILHAVKLQREFEKQGITSNIFSCHPGNARTKLMNSDDNTILVRIAFKYIITPIMAVTGTSHSLYDGALPAIEALVADDAQPYKVYSPNSRNELTGAPISRDIDRTHFKEEDIDKLWEKTQDLLDLSVSDYM